MELSTVINNLLPKAQLITPQSWTDIPPTTQICLVAANERKVFLGNQELEQLKQQQLIDQSQYDLLIQLRELAPQLIDRARQDLLQEFPVLTQPGGGLYPATREKACWRDLWHFLRCISYAIVVNKPQFTNPEGSQYMRQLYQAMAVPLNAMVAAIGYLKYHSVDLISPGQPSTLEPYFDHLLGVLKLF